MRETIKTENAPGAIGPYSQAVKINGFVYTSGQLGFDPVSGKMPEDIEAQTEQVLKNIAAILETVGLEMSDICKTLVFISNMNNFGRMNEVYSKFFPEQYPARSCVEVARLPKDALVEIEAIAWGE